MKRENVVPCDCLDAIFWHVRLSMKMIFCISSLYGSLYKHRLHLIAPIDLMQNDWNKKKSLPGPILSTLSLSLSLSLSLFPKVKENVSDVYVCKPKAESSHISIFLQTLPVSVFSSFSPRTLSLWMCMPEPLLRHTICRLVCVFGWKC